MVPIARQVPNKHTAIVGLAVAVLALALGSNQAFGLDDVDMWTGTVLLALLATAVVLPGRAALGTVGALVAVWLLGYLAYNELPDALDTSIPVSEAIGTAAYAGESYVDLQLTGALCIVVVLAVVAVLAFRHSRAQARAATPAPEPFAEPATGSSRRSLKLTVLGGALVALTIVPNLDHELIFDSKVALGANWDAANLISWSYFQQEGLTPMADYFYPYSGQWMFADFPTGPVVRYLYQALMLAASGWALWRLLGARPVRITLCLLVVVGVGLLEDVPALITPPVLWRYVPALVLAVVYAAAGPLRHRRPNTGHAVVGVVCAATAVVSGGDVLLMGLGGAAFVALGELLFVPALRSWRPAVRALAVDVLPFAAGIAVMVLFWVIQGSFEASAGFITDARGVSAASAYVYDPAAPLTGLVVEPSLTALRVLLPVLLLVVAFAHRRAGGRAGVVSSQLLFAAAGTASILLAKHLVRAQDMIPLMIPLVALLWSAIVMWKPASVRSAVVAGLAAGAFVSLLQVNAETEPLDYVGDALESPGRVLQDVGLVFDRDDVRRAGNERFAAERFAAVPDKLNIADPLTQFLGGPATPASPSWETPRPCTSSSTSARRSTSRSTTPRAGASRSAWLTRFARWTRRASCGGATSSST